MCYIELALAPQHHWTHIKRFLQDETHVRGNIPYKKHVPDWHGLVG
ncbi:1261_t:CDS:2 [Cetraspora pellucida]|uniref:1261_t:CDS:1 n=1 Tax=Cetraspora pellucida TaxID=1433469 RepID=A0ACA9KJM0_9GLOM|nr:1261_t:CDS:2 [Cetraspora pellucida]